MEPTYYPYDQDENGFKIEVDSPEQIIFNFFGCGGTGQNGQFQIGSAISQQSNPALFTCVLGDLLYSNSNFPNDGARSPKDPKWIEQFQKPYQDIKHPMFVIPGNHEYGFHNSKKKPKEIADYATSFRFIPAKIQTSVSKCVDNIFPSGRVCREHFLNQQYNELIQEKNLESPELLMSSKGYYSIDIYVKDEKQPTLTIFMLDSNVYNNREFDPELAQQEWLKTRLEKSQAKKHIIFQHHPLATYNKLFFSKDDINCYQLSEEDKSNLPGFNSGNYNDFYRESLLQSLGAELIKKIDLSGSAHAHQQVISTLDDHNAFTHMNRENKFVQCIIGSGGGKLQPIEHFDPNLHYFSQQKLGFAEFQYHSDNHYEIKYIGTENQVLTHYTFDDKNTPIEKLHQNNRLWKDINERLFLVLKAHFIENHQLKLESHFTTLIEKLLDIAHNVKQPALKRKLQIKAFTEQCFSKTIFQDMINALSETLEVNQDDISHYIDHLTEQRSEKLNTAPYQSIKDVIFHQVLSDPQIIFTDEESLIKIFSLIFEEKPIDQIIPKIKSEIFYIQNDSLKEALEDTITKINKPHQQASLELFSQLKKNVYDTTRTSTSTTATLSI